MNNTLEQLKLNQSGIIQKVNCKSLIKQRLLDMGFVKGSIVKLETIAPLGDPIGIKIKGYKISLRKHEAKNIDIKIIKK